MSTIFGSLKVGDDFRFACSFDRSIPLGVCRKVGDEAFVTPTGERRGTKAVKASVRRVFVDARGQKGR